MERDRQQQVRRAARKPGRGDLGDEGSQRSSQRAAAAELERMNGLARDLPIANGCARIRERGRPVTAAPTEVGAGFVALLETWEPWKRQPADRTPWRTDPIKRLPADAA